jgi:hypothetical protein
MSLRFGGRSGNHKPASFLFKRDHLRKRAAGFKEIDLSEAFCHFSCDNSARRLNSILAPRRGIDRLEKLIGRDGHI